MRRSANLRGSRRHVPIVTAAVVIAIALVSGAASAAEPPVLAKARALYNAADYDGAIAAAEQARAQPGAADAAALVEARARLERYRGNSDPADLAAAREAFSAIYLAFLGKPSGPKAGWLLTTLKDEFVLRRLDEAMKAR